MENKIHFVYVYDYLTSTAFHCRSADTSSKLSNQLFKSCDSYSKTHGGEKSTDDKQSMKKGDFVFHIIKISHAQIAMCVSDTQPILRICYHLLEEIQENWFLDMKKSIGNKLLKELIAKHNDPSNDDIFVAQEKIDGIKTIIVDNLDKVLKNVEGIEKLDEKVQLLDKDAVEFHKIGRVIRRRSLCNKRMIGILMLLSFIVVLFIICLVALGIVASFGIYFLFVAKIMNVT